MLVLIIDKPTEKELRDAVIKLEQILDKKMDAEKAQAKQRKKTLPERVDIHNERLGRQGKDIFGLSEKIKEIENWQETLKTGILLNAKCSGGALKIHKKKIEEMEEEIKELKKKGKEE